jgi:hypothetical protein
MVPTADAGKLIWEMIVLTGTLVTLSIFAYELIRGRRLAKAKQDAARRWSEIHTLSLTDTPSKKSKTALGDPWASRDANKAY